MKKHSILLLFTVLACQVIAQTRLIEKVTRKGNEMAIPYEKYKLANGLTVLIHEDHSDPMVYVNVMYHVGSAREQEGRSGFAHFFEHMMFEGSEHVANGQHAKIITEAGGKYNGNTTRDRTEYWELLPSNELETALWLESDRMGFFVDSVTQQKFEIQRETVKNERGQNYDNRPFGLVQEKIDEALYPSSHPYAWQTIGYIGDLNNSTVQDLKDFFMRWYGPNNAVLTIAGDVTTADVIKLVEKYFASISAGPEVKPQVLAPVVLDKDRFISYADRVRLPQVTFTFPTIPTRHPDEAALDILAEILGEGKTSVFYQYFIKADDAEWLDISHPCSELAGEFRIKIWAKKVKHFDKMMNEAFDEFEKKGVTEEDLKKFKTRWEVKKMDEIEGIEGKGALLSYYQTYTDNPNYIAKDIERYNAVTKEDVMRVYKTYIKDKFKVIISAYPRDNAGPVKRDNYTPAPRNTNVPESAEYKNLKYVKPVDNFDRRIQPVPGQPPVLKVPDFWTSKMENGLKLIGTKSDEQPTSMLKITIEAGHRFENHEFEGITDLTAMMLEESTMKYSSEQVNLKLNQLGSTINVRSSDNEINIYVYSLTRNFDSTLAILQEVLLHPKFDRDDYDRIKTKQLDVIRSGAFNPKTFPDELFSKLIYGRDNILGNSSQGTDESVSGISAKEVKDFYENYCVPSLSSVVFVGDLEKEQVLSKLAFLKDWKDHKVVLNDPGKAPPINTTTIYFLNKSGSTQSQIRVGYMGLPFDAIGDFYRAQIATYALAVPFTSRINLNLREQHGYCYSVLSSFDGDRFPGPYIIEADVKANATDSALMEIMKEIKKYAEKGISQDELAFTQNSMAQKEVLKYETAYQKANFLKKVLDYNLPGDFTTLQSTILKNMTLEEVNRLAKENLPYKNMMILVIGDKPFVFNGLLDMGYTVKEISFLGTVMKTW